MIAVEDFLITAPEAARIFCLNSTTCLTWRRRGKLTPVARVGGVWLFKATDVCRLARRGEISVPDDLARVISERSHALAGSAVEAAS